jgi:hypothetical protein
MLPKAEMVVFTTQREIRNFKEKLEGGTRLLPKLFTIGDFFNRAIVVPGKSFVDDYLRRYYLFQAVEGVEVEKLGFEREFLHFFRNSDLLIGFFTEVFLERVEWEKLKSANIYGEYEEHLEILGQIYQNYKQLLEERNLTDKVLLEPGSYRINPHFFADVERVTLHLKGYLTRFEREILEEIAGKLPVRVEITFRLSSYNRPLVEKMFGEVSGVGEEGDYRIDFGKKRVLERKPLPERGEVELYRVKDRLEQTEFLFGAIKKLVEEEGIPPEKIVVILPEESFKNYLKGWDLSHNLNFAMGWQIGETPFYYRLEAVYRYLMEGENHSFQLGGEWIGEFTRLNGGDEIVEWVKEKFLAVLPQFKGVEREKVEETFFKIEKLVEALEKVEPLQLLHFILEKLRTLRIDDTRGGKITTLGVLESRGAEFEGAVIVDFNSGIVPKVEEKDYFLNTFTRQLVGLPTQQEKEALQKGFYLDILTKAKKTFISYREGGEQRLSRFAYQLELPEPKPNPFRFFNRTPLSPKKYPLPEKFSPPTRLSPTAVIEWLECPRKFYFQYILRLKEGVFPQEEAEEEIFGLRLHNAIEEVLKLYRQGKLPLNEWEEYFTAIWKRVTDQLPPVFQIEWEGRWWNGVKQFAQTDWKRVKEKRYQVEKTYRKKIGKWELEARIDRIETGENGEIIGVDYKTGKVDFSKRKKGEVDKLEVQASFYSLLIPNLQKTDFISITRDKGVEIVPKQGDLDILEILEKLPRTPEPTPHSANCVYCPFKSLCGK